MQLKVVSLYWMSFTLRSLCCGAQLLCIPYYSLDQVDVKFAGRSPRLPLFQFARPALGQRGVVIKRTPVPNNGTPLLGWGRSFWSASGCTGLRGRGLRLSCFHLLSVIRLGWSSDGGRYGDGGLRSLHILPLLFAFLRLLRLFFRTLLVLPLPLTSAGSKTGKKLSKLQRKDNTRPKSTHLLRDLKERNFSVHQ